MKGERWILVLLLVMAGCDSQDAPPAAWLQGTHFTHSRYETIKSYALVCNNGGKIVGTVEQEHEWYAKSTNMKLLAEYETFWQAANALQLYVQNTDACGEVRR